MKNYLSTLILIFSLALLLISCGEATFPEGTDSDPSSSSDDSDNDEGSEDDNNETKISKNNDLESHNMGQNCVTCHVSGGSGEGWFNISGTVYQSDKVTAYPNGVVKLYSGKNQTGTLVKTIAVDGRGNFYSTESISFAAGLYPVVVYNGQTKAMVSAATSGSCNACHISGGVAGNVIYAP